MFRQNLDSVRVELRDRRHQILDGGGAQLVERHARLPDSGTGSGSGARGAPALYRTFTLYTYSLYHFGEKLS